MTPWAFWPLWVRMALAAGLGAAAAAGLQPIGLWSATVVALMVVPLLLGAAGSSRQAALTGWALGVGYFAHGLAWIIEPFQVDAARHGWMAPFALIILSSGLALFWAAAFWGARVLGRTPKSRILALVATLSLAELARAYVLTGFPWNGLSQVWIDTDAALLLALVGPHGLTMLMLLACLPIGLVMVPSTRPAATVAAILPALALMGAVAGLGAPARNPVMTGSVVRLVQPNAPQHQKWDSEYIAMFFDRLVSFTSDGPRPDLVVWPETALTNWLHNSGPALEVISEAAGGAEVALGILRWDDIGRYNTMIRLDARGRLAGTYDKHHLVPFGEYIPVSNLASAFGLSGLAAQLGEGYSAGPGPEVMDFGAIGRAVPLICYEAVFPQDVGGTPERATFLLQITNDAWFGRNSGPYQHLAQARMRAIEQGLPMVRAANTGVSAMIDPWGRITHAVPLGEAGYVDAPLPAPLAATIYARTGDWPAFAAILALILGLWGYKAVKNRIKTD
ncbi:apolipoprotein N-acyltransferase [Arenibacterium sp. CAU 1754]